MRSLVLELIIDFLLNTPCSARSSQYIAFAQYTMLLYITFS